jgi:4-oxalocrotonate tautomerase
MPHVIVQLLEGRTTEQKRAAAKAITDAVAETLNATREGVTVVFQDFPHGVLRLPAAFDPDRRVVPRRVSSSAAASHPMCLTT